MTYRLRDWNQPPLDASSRWFQARGRAFEHIIKRILGSEGLEARGSLRPSGEEIDGAFYLGNRTFLLEAKWRKDSIPASDLYAFKGKVDGKLVGTLGVFISMSGYSRDAIDALKAGKDINLILFDAEDLQLVDAGILTFAEAMKRKLRYAAEEGQPYRPLGSDKLVSTKSSRRKLMSANDDELAARPNGDTDWDIVVEGRTDEISMRIIFDRLNIGDKVRIWVAGGQLAVPSLVRRLQESHHERVAAFVEPDLLLKLRDELLQIFDENPKHLVVISPSIEEWLEMACPDEYLRSVPPTSIREKAARRWANSADIGLIIRHATFGALLRDMLGDSFDGLLSQHSKQ